jgi:hypothetical protein
MRMMQMVRTVPTMGGTVDRVGTARNDSIY